jgi:hypothetical protein
MRPAGILHLRPASAIVRTTTTELSMTSQNDETRTGMTSETPNAAEGVPNASRRALLRGASVAALPTILTLKSGAALAQSSNLIGTVRTASQATGDGGRVQCLDMASAEGGTPSKLDLGQDPMLHVQYIGKRQYYRPAWNGKMGDTSKPVAIDTMCKEGGVYWYFDHGWKSTTPGYNSRGVEAGFLVSATALASFASDIKIKTFF